MSAWSDFINGFNASKSSGTSGTQGNGQSGSSSTTQKSNTPVIIGAVLILLILIGVGIYYGTKSDSKTAKA